MVVAKVYTVKKEKWHTVIKQGVFLKYFLWGREYRKNEFQN